MVLETHGHRLGGTGGCDIDSRRNSLIHHSHRSLRVPDPSWCFGGATVRPSAVVYERRISQDLRGQFHIASCPAVHFDDCPDLWVLLDTIGIGGAARVQGEPSVYLQPQLRYCGLSPGDPTQRIVAWMELRAIVDHSSPYLFVDRSRCVGRVVLDDLPGRASGLLQFRVRPGESTVRDLLPRDVRHRHVFLRRVCVPLPARVARGADGQPLQRVIVQCR